MKTQQSIGRTFDLSPRQVTKYNEWRESLPPAHFGVASTGIKFSFEPTSVGMIIKVERVDGHKLDLTEWEFFA